MCDEVPDDLSSAFILENVLSSEECQRFIDVTEQLGYTEDAPVSLPHSFRHMQNCNWLVHASVADTIFARIVSSLPAAASKVVDGAAVGLNARFRCYKYQAGDYFKYHTDGSWPGSLALPDSQGKLKLEWDAFGDRWSHYTFLILLSDGYTGGRTLFKTASGTIAVRTPKGAVLCFPHGGHPLHLLHAGELLDVGTKYMIRTEILYKRTARTDEMQAAWLR